MNQAAYIKIALFFVVLGCAGAGYVVLSANGINTFSTNTYEAVLHDASGLSTRSKVYLAGVQVGKVQGIQLTGTEARVRFVVFKDVELHQDAVLSRRASSLLGTSVLSLDPGTELTPIALPGSRIGTAPITVTMDTALGMVDDIGKELILLLQEFRTNQMALFAVSLETFNSIAQKIDLQADAQLDRISRVLESAALIGERTEGILRTGEGDILGSVEEIHLALANIRAITAEIAAGRGNLGQTIYDDRLYDNILSAAQKTGEALDNISSLAKTADGVVSSAGEVVDKVLGLGIQVDTNARYDFRAQTARAGASIRVVPGSNDRWYRVGVASIPDGTSSRTIKETIYSENGIPTGNVYTEDTTTTKFGFAVDAELARKFGMFTLRGGLLDNSAGFGLDLQPINQMSLSGELFRFTSDDVPNLRGTLTFYPFFDPDSDKPWNWIYLRGGINNALNRDRDFFLGGGLRFADREVKGLIGLVPVLNY